MARSSQTAVGDVELIIQTPCLEKKKKAQGFHAFITRKHTQWHQFGKKNWSKTVKKCDIKTFFIFSKG